MSSGYDRIYSDLLPELARCDLAESATRLGLKLLSTGEVAAQLCGREYLITNRGVEAADGQAVNVNYRSILAYYILAKGSGEVEHSWVSLGRISGMPDGQKTHDKGMLLRPLVRELGAHYDRFQCAARKLGGIAEPDSGDGAHVWSFQLLPKIPVRLMFYEADEEFPADIQLFFDRSARRFLEYECLAFLAGCFVSSLLAASREAVGVEQAQ
jgi:hypothetical protein